ncbi:MAG: extracellular solute-binding protein [Pseudomonadota bacterium]
MCIARLSASQLTAAGIASPTILKASGALASSGTVKVFAWQNSVQPNIIEAFEAENGVTLYLMTYGSKDEPESTVRANGGKGFGVVIPSFVRDSASLGGTFKGEQILLPFDWGTEGVTYNSADMPIEGQVSYGDLWSDAAKGKAAFRQKSVIMGTGLYLDAQRIDPSNRMLDVYKSEDGARRVWGDVTKWIPERKDNFGAFWSNATEATPVFRDAGSIIGQTWDTTGLLLNRENGDYLYRAPNEGIIIWLNSFGILKGAEKPIKQWHS